jgi:hypothetical protein
MTNVNTGWYGNSLESSTVWKSQRRENPSHTEWYDLTKEQYEKLMEFDKELRAKRKGG